MDFFLYPYNIFISKPSLSVLCMFPFVSLSLSLSHYLPLYLTIPPSSPYYLFFSIFFFILSTVSTLLSAFFLQIPHDNFNLSKYARELFFFFFLFLSFFFCRPVFSPSKYIYLFTTSRPFFFLSFFPFFYNFF